MNAYIEEHQRFVREMEEKKRESMTNVHDANEVTEGVKEMRLGTVTLNETQGEETKKEGS